MLSPDGSRALSFMMESSFGTDGREAKNTQCNRGWSENEGWRVRGRRFHTATGYV
jgi:hypothetical protein